MEQVKLDKIWKHKTQSGKYKVKISIFMTYLEYIWSKFDPVIPVVSNIEVNLPDNYITPNSIGEAIKGLHKQIWKEDLFVNYDKNKSSTFFWLPYQSNTSLMSKGLLFTYFYKNQGMQLFQCMEICCKPL